VQQTEAVDVSSDDWFLEDHGRIAVRMRGHLKILIQAPLQSLVEVPRKDDVRGVSTYVLVEALVVRFLINERVGWGAILDA
jgi:hypothetical protein